MNMEWISEKGASLLAFAVGLGLIGMSFVDSPYRFLFFFVAIGVLIYAYKRFKRHETPFEKHERELRKKRL
jgi:hypothetical protein